MPTSALLEKPSDNLSDSKKIKHKGQVYVIDDDSFASLQESIAAYEEGNTISSREFADALEKDIAKS